MRKNVTYVAQDRLLAIASKLGFSPLEQAGFIKLAAAKGRNMYVAKTKRVGRIDLSGFVPEGIEGVTLLGAGESFGAVRAQIDFSREEKAILRTFAACLKAMKKLPERVIEKKSVVAKTPVRAPETTDEKAARIALIAQVAAEHNVAVSASVFASSPAEETSSATADEAPALATE